MQRIEHEINGQTAVHYDGPGGTGYALCGQDIEGDSTHGDFWTEGRPTTARATCAQCRAIVEHVRGRKTKGAQ